MPHAIRVEAQRSNQAQEENMTMERWMIAGAAMVTLLAGCASDKGPKPAAPTVTSEESRGKNSMERVETVTMEAKVVSVDQKNRQVTLLDHDGKKRTITVGPEVKNLPQVRKGDMVTVAYRRSVLARLRKKGSAKPDAAAGQELYTAQPGEMPAAVGASVIHIVATVTDIDKAKSEVTLKGPKGRSAVVAVKDPTVLDRVKKGDLVEIDYTEAVAIAVETPQH
jgi:hypothetical protein